MPADNSILPDLETNLPSTSASANFNFPTMSSPGDSGRQDLELRYKQFHPSVIADVTPITLDARDARRDLDLRYNTPQISASAGTMSKMIPALVESFTPIDDFEYNNPQVSALASPTYRDVTPIVDDNLRFDDKLPQVSATAGYQGRMEQVTPIDYSLETKTEGSQPAFAYSKGVKIFDAPSTEMSTHGGVEKLGRRLDSYAYTVPTNTQFKSEMNMVTPDFRTKATSLNYNPAIPQSAIPRKGISNPHSRVKVRKDQGPKR